MLGALTPAQLGASVASLSITPAEYEALTCESPRFPLSHCRSVEGIPVRRYVIYSNCHYIAPAQLAIDGKIEEREVAHLSLHLELCANGPDVAGLQRRFWAYQLALVAGRAERTPSRVG